MKPIALNGGIETLAPHPEEAVSLARPSRTRSRLWPSFATGPTACSLRTSLMNDIDVIRAMETLY